MPKRPRHCVRTAQQKRAGNGLVAREKESEVRGQRGPHGLAHAARLPFDGARAGCRHVDTVCDSNHATAEGLDRLPEGGAIHSPGAAFWWHGPAIDTARGEDRGGNCGCWPHPPPAGVHRRALRRSWTESVCPAGQRSVPSGCRANSRPEKRPAFQGRATSGGPYPCVGEAGSNA